MVYVDGVTCETDSTVKLTNGTEKVTGKVQPQQMAFRCMAIMYRWKIKGYGKCQEIPDPYYDYVIAPNVYFPSCQIPAM